jgi:hypothetical protein
MKVATREREKKEGCTMGLRLLDVLIVAVVALKILVALAILRHLAAEPKKAVTRRPPPPAHANGRYQHVRS